jgi:hypothetical protein
LLNLLRNRKLPPIKKAKSDQKYCVSFLVRVNYSISVKTFRNLVVAGGFLWKSRNLLTVKSLWKGLNGNGKRKFGKPSSANKNSSGISSVVLAVAADG